MIRATILLFLVWAGLCIGGCVAEHPHYSAEIEFNRESVEAGHQVQIGFRIRDPEGKQISDLEIVHEKPMHLFLVSSDLSQYFHEHPQKQGDGTYRFLFNFPNGGRFKIFIDYTPKGGEQTVESFDIDVKGAERSAIELVPETVFERSIGGITVKMEPGGELKKQKDIFLRYQVFDTTSRQPVDDLENYLGEKAHFVIIRKGLGRFIHAHPMSLGNKMAEMSNVNKERQESEMRELMGRTDPDSRVVAMANFPNSGIYKIFAQFKRNGRIITVPFVLEVK